MKIVGCDLHTRYQQIAMLDEEAGELTELAPDGNGNTVMQRTYVRANGELMADIDLTDGQTHFRLNDWLGNLRVTTDLAGVQQGTWSNLPFGEGPPCPGPSSDCHFFTGKERDAESGNDYFGARYYGSSMGRFLSPDWAAKVEPVPYAKLENPQSLNLYTYVLDNPLSKIDPDGHDGWDKLLNLFQGKGWVDTQRSQPAPVTVSASTPKWHYQQSTGNVSLQVKLQSSNGKSGEVTVSAPAGGYSGRGTGLNNPAAQGVSERQDAKNAGPLPRGEYTIGSPQNNKLGPESMHLTPSPGTDMAGRDANSFWIHADNPSKAAFNSSEGCAVLPHSTRTEIGGSGVNQLKVDQ